VYRSVIKISKISSFLRETIAISGGTVSGGANYLHGNIFMLKSRISLRSRKLAPISTRYAEWLDNTLQQTKVRNRSRICFGNATWNVIAVTRNRNRLPSRFLCVHRKNPGKQRGHFVYYLSVHNAPVSAPRSAVRVVMHSPTIWECIFLQREICCVNRQPRCSWFIIL